jgi:hypothetical protein
MSALSPDVFAGRDPAWREAWEEDLDVAQRQQVVNALRAGVRVQDEQLEPFVYGLVARRRRQNRWRLVQIVVALWISGLWIYVTTVVHPSAAKWFWITSFVIALVALPVLVRGESKRLDKAEAAQQVRRA